MMPHPDRPACERNCKHATRDVYTSTKSIGPLPNVIGLSFVGVMLSTHTLDVDKKESAT